MANFQARQGDVLIRSAKSVPVGAKKTDWTKEGRVILAYGEQTGHAHAFPLSFASMYSTEAGQRFLRLKEGAQLTHEEHATISPPAGTYEVVQQCEWSALSQMARRVAD